MGCGRRAKKLNYLAGLCGIGLVLFSMPAAGASVVETLRNLVITEKAGHTFVDADLSGPVAFSITAKTNPNKVTIDLPRMRFALPRGSGSKGGGTVSAYHVGQVAKTGAQIVLDTKEPVAINASVLRPATDGQPAHLTIDLGSALQNLASPPETPQETSSITPAAPPPLPAHKFVIAIDPGHGGMDPGASSTDGLREKEVVLAFGLTLKAALEQTGHYAVVMTRDNDKFIKLEDRVQFARDAKADLFIAIHADTLDDDSVRGTTLYTVSDKASDAMAEALAAKENRADILSGMDLGKQSEDVANLLINLAQRESRNDAMLFAKKAVSELRPVTELTTKPVRSAAFVVLKAPDVPSVLVELGYLSNVADRNALRSTLWRTRMADATTRAINSYFISPATAALK